MYVGVGYQGQLSNSRGYGFIYQLNGRGDGVVRLQWESMEGADRTY